MTVYITAVHMAGGTQHQHIADVKWRNSATQATGDCSRAMMVKYIEEDKGDARVANGASYVHVGVVDASPRYIRTYADGKYTDNLLALPRY